MHRELHRSSSRARKGAGDGLLDLARSARDLHCTTAVSYWEEVRVSTVEVGRLFILRSPPLSPQAGRRGPQSTLVQSNVFDPTTPHCADDISQWSYKRNGLPPRSVYLRTPSNLRTPSVLRSETMGFSTILSLTLPFVLAIGTAAENMNTEELKDSDFVFDFSKLPNNLETDAGTFQLIGSATQPGLVDSGAAIARVVLRPGAINMPHYHPRATEVIFVVRGRLRVCFNQENGGNRFCNDVKAGQLAVFPITTIHYQQNAGDDEAEFIAILTSDNPGAYSLPPRLFELPSEVLASAFDRTVMAINRWRDRIPSNPAPRGRGRGAIPAATVEEALALSGF
eukprot:Plantae.Rhodophyta-Rhodochaete_pulchella.ctg19465.p1 GENE.Plantae.Rhodophyta-Rhodochaete_pulchella.ctg19465~~Plantae.Rhodophyta-Rhodochaete_pulchella.ctg19465.p1  ORF type:complete len:339 (-),score=33.24 Plantae.Rhodophyta-Rhodochaete_pulchella.ctg19465:307-1323(-)